MGALVLSALLQAALNQRMRARAADVGGVRRLHALMAVATVATLTPAAIFSSLVAEVRCAVVMFMNLHL